MIRLSKTLADIGLVAGKLDGYTSVGCYPLCYIVTLTHTHETGVWCAKCCNENDDEDSEVTAHDINYEDNSLYCDCCDERIESAYAEPEDEENGYHDCPCCGDVVMGPCADCKAAECDLDAGDDCQIPQCFECCDGEGPRASFLNDSLWHSNCDEPCPNAGKSWKP